MIVVQHEPNRVLVNVYGEFGLADFKEFEDIVNYKIKFEGALDLLFDSREMTDVTLDLAFKDISFTREHAHDFRKIAVLTQSEWVTWGAWLSQIFMQADIRVFDEEAEAKAWLDLTEGDASDIR